MFTEFKDGESVEVRGSARKPYIVKRVGDVISCSCPAWRNQSLPINKRTCKHIRQTIGDVADTARIGSPSITKTEPAGKAVPPKILLAEKWTPEIDPTGWWMSEKLDGVRGYWNGEEMISRLGNKFYLPGWYEKQLPPFPLDGELWIGRKKFQETVSIVRTEGGKDSLWKKVKYVVFDAPEVAGTFEDRMVWIKKRLPYSRPGKIQAYILDQTICTGMPHLMEFLGLVESIGAEGVMLREAKSLYEGVRSPTLLKVKTVSTDEAVVTGYKAGKHGNTGRVGSLDVRWKDKEFNISSGLSFKDRANPPKIGSKVTFSYVGFTDDGIPKFAGYVGPAIDK